MEFINELLFFKHKNKDKGQVMTASYVERDIEDEVIHIAWERAKSWQNGWTGSNLFKFRNFYDQKDFNSQPLLVIT